MTGLSTDPAAGPSADQLSLVGLVDDVLSGRSANEQLAAVEATDERFDAVLWSSLASSGRTPSRSHTSSYTRGSGFFSPTSCE